MPLINGFADELLVEAGPTGVHRVFEITQTHTQNCRIFLSTFQYLWDFC